ncbi:O-antigen ligase [Thiomicrospira sp. ALE5]|nr:O-antigen ligase [Thiomicrospira sp. ALE5]
MDKKILAIRQAASKIEYVNFLKVFFVAFSFWVVLLPGPFSFESLFLLLSIIYVAIFRRPFSEIKDLPWLWFWVAIGLFVVLTTMPVFFHDDFGEQSQWLLQRRLAVIFVVLYVFIMFWQLRLTENQVWWGVIVGTGAIAFYLGYEVWHLESFDQITDTRFGTTFTNPLRFGIYSMLMAVVLLGGYIWAFRTGSLAIVLLTLAFFVAVLGAFMSQTRSAWLGFPEAVLGWSLFYLYYLKRSNTLSLKQIVIGGLVFFVSIFILTISAYDVVEKRVMQGKTDIQNYVNNEHAGSIGRRFVMWEAAWIGFKEEPLRGVGLENVRDHMDVTTRQIMQERFGRNRNVLYGHRHNQFVEEAYTRGVLAFIGLAITMGFLFWYFFSRVRKNKLQSHTDSKLLSPWPVMGFLVTIAYFLAMQGEAILNLSAGIAHFFFLMTFLVVMASNKNWQQQDSHNELN